MKVTPQTRHERNTRSASPYPQGSSSPSKPTAPPPTFEEVLNRSAGVLIPAKPFQHAPYTASAMDDLASFLAAVNITATNPDSPRSSEVMTPDIPYDTTRMTISTTPPYSPLPPSDVASDIVEDYHGPIAVSIATVGLEEEDLYKEMIAARLGHPVPFPVLEAVGNFSCGKPSSKGYCSLLYTIRDLTQLNIFGICPNTACQMEACDLRPLEMMLRNNQKTLTTLSLDFSRVQVMLSRKKKKYPDIRPILDVSFYKLEALALHGFDFSDRSEEFIRFLWLHRITLRYLAEWDAELLNGHDVLNPASGTPILPLLTGLLGSVALCKTLLGTVPPACEPPPLTDLNIIAVNLNPDAKKKKGQNDEKGAEDTKDTKLNSSITTVLQFDLGLYSTTLEYFTVSLTLYQKIDWPIFVESIMGNAPRLKEVRILADPSIRCEMDGAMDEHMTMKQWAGPLAQFASSTLQTIYVPWRFAYRIGLVKPPRNFAQNRSKNLYDFLDCFCEALKVLAYQDKEIEPASGAILFNRGETTLLPPDMIEVYDHKHEYRRFRYFIRPDDATAA